MTAIDVIEQDLKIGHTSDLSLYTFSQKRQNKITRHWILKGFLIEMRRAVPHLRRRIFLNEREHLDCERFLSMIS
jgi:hypothetical protein